MKKCIYIKHFMIQFDSGCRKTEITKKVGISDIYVLVSNSNHNLSSVFRLQWSELLY
jgi:hypothetical protein